MRRYFLPNGVTEAGPSDSLRDVTNLRFMWRVKQRTASARRVDTTIKIHSFPALKMVRLPDGGWQLYNRFVVYTADLTPDGPYKHGVHGLKPFLPSAEDMARPPPLALAST